MNYCFVRCRSYHWLPQMGQDFPLSRLRQRASGIATRRSSRMSAGEYRTLYLYESMVRRNQNQSFIGSHGWYSRLGVPRNA